MLKILVVDDVAFNTRLVKMMLERAGHYVLTASSGPEALELLQEHNDVELVFSDLAMPEMDGVETLRQAKHLKRYTDEGMVALPPFILVSEETQEKVLSAAFKTGFAEILKKPPAADKLLSIAERVENGTYEGANDAFLSVVYCDELDKTGELTTFLSKRNFDVQSADKVHEAMALLSGFRKVSILIAVVTNYALFTNLLRAYKAYKASKNKELPPIVVYLHSEEIAGAQADTELSNGVQYFSQPVNYVLLDELIESFGLKREVQDDVELGENAVLLIDDVAFSRSTLEKGLKRHGVEVIAVDSVVEALKAYQQYPQIKLICTKTQIKDVLINQVYAACEKIQRYTDEGPVPMADFILLADQKDKMEVRNYIKMGIKNILLRPLPTEKIISEIQSAALQAAQAKPETLLGDPLAVL